jgi:hypothetical protein
MYDAHYLPCPVSTVLLSRIVQADRRGRRAIAVSLPDDTRAELALYLYNRPDLQHIACDVAAGCEPMTLIRKGGRTGFAVLAAAEELPRLRVVRSR